MAILLNLTGLGLGYFYLRRWRRGLLHLCGTVGWVVVGFLTNAASWAFLWLIVLALWLLWMTFDGWRQAQASHARRHSALVLALLILGLEVGAIIGYMALGRAEFSAAMDAYRQGDCRTASQRWGRVTTLYELTLSPSVGEADARIAECALWLYAANAQEAGDYGEATAGYGLYLERYPESEISSLTREAAAASYGTWAAQLQESGEHAAAVEQYEALLAAYPDTAAGERAGALLAETCFGWAAQLREGGDFAAAIEKYQLVLTDYPDAPAHEQALLEAAETYAAWAAELRQAGRYDEALEAYQAILVLLPHPPAEIGAEAGAAGLLTEWAAQLRADGQYEQAVARYQLILDQFAATEPGQQAETWLAETYWEWATSLRERDWEAAIQTYQLILDRFPGTAAADQAQQDLDALFARVGQALGRGSYCDALPLMEAFLQPSVAFANEAAASMPGALYGCGVERHRAGEHGQAAELYEQVIADYPLTLRADDAQAALVALQVDVRRASFGGSLEEVTPPAWSDYVLGDEALVEIVNDSDAGIEILFSAEGPESQSVAIAGCPSCTSYAISPDTARAAAESATVYLAPGRYDVLILCADCPSPLTSEALHLVWWLESGRRYDVFYFVVQRSTFPILIPTLPAIPLQPILIPTLPPYFNLPLATPTPTGS